MKSEDWRGAVIAQCDDKDYQESGWVAWVVGDCAYLGHYFHCSCYGTFDSLCGGGVGDSIEEGTPSFGWSGTVSELIALAESKGDPNMAGRTADTKDYDYDHLMNVYEQVIEWSKR
mgnify:CR=1 FL=1